MLRSIYPQDSTLSNTPPSNDGRFSYTTNYVFHLILVVNHRLRSGAWWWWWQWPEQAVQRRWRCRWRWRPKRWWRVWSGRIWYKRHPWNTKLKLKVAKLLVLHQCRWWRRRLCGWCHHLEQLAPPPVDFVAFTHLGLILVTAACMSYVQDYMLHLHLQKHKARSDVCNYTSCYHCACGQAFHV